MSGLGQEERVTLAAWHQENDIFLLWGNLRMLANEFPAEPAFLRANHRWTAPKIQGAKKLAIHLDCYRIGLWGPWIKLLSVMK
jgi:hypothetical protein